jgi:DNA-binding CsgD family transcriptional regulator
MVVGDPGTGKTYISMALAELLAKDFKIDGVLFGILNLFRKINKGELKPGSCIILEEVGVEANNKRWFDKFVQSLNFLLQTWRHRRIILFVNAPDSTEVARAVNKRVDLLFETLGIDYKNKQVIVKPMKVSVNKRTGKIYYKYLRFLTREGAVKVTRMRISLPSKELIKAYEKKKLEYTTRLYLRLEKELSSPTDLTDKQNEVYDLLKKGNNQLEIAGKLQRSKSVVSRMVAAIKKKGYTWERKKKLSKLPSN